MTNQMANLPSRLRRMSYKPCLISFQNDLSLISLSTVYKTAQLD